MNRSQRWDPKKPAAPVMSTFFKYFFLVTVPGFIHAFFYLLFAC